MFFVIMKICQISLSKMLILLVLLVAQNEDIMIVNKVNCSCQTYMYIYYLNYVCFWLDLKNPVNQAHKDIWLGLLKREHCIYY